MVHDASVPAHGRASVDLARATVVFQQVPGPGAAGIDGLRARANGVAAVGVQGEFHVPLPGGAGQLELLAPAVDQVVASFVLYPRDGLPPAPEGTDHVLHDVRVALNHLGYNAGREATSSDAPAPPDAQLERAMLCFEADAGLTPEGITGRVQENHRTRAIRERAGERARTRLRSWLQADQRDQPTPAGDAAPAGDPLPESADVELGGLGSTCGGMPRTLAVLDKVRIVLVSIGRDDSAPAELPLAAGRHAYGPNPSAPWVEESFFDDHDYGDGHRGPMLTVMELGEPATYTVKLRRENLADDAPLHISSCLESAVSSPGAVATGFEAVVSFTVQANAAGGRDHQPIDLLVQLGGPTGPTLHTLRVVVLRPMDVRVEVLGIRHLHMSAAEGGEDFVTNARVADTFARCNKLFQQAGIRLVFDGEVSYHRDDSYRYDLEPPDPEHHPDVALDRMLTVRHYPDRLNVYVSPSLWYFAHHSSVAIGQSTATGSSQTAIFCQPAAFADSTTIPRVLAHELGHALGLIHPDDDDLADQSEWQRVTSWTLRRFMFYHVNAPPGLPDWHPFAAAGAADGAAPGTMLTSRNHRGDALDNEVRRLRNRIAGVAGAGNVYDGVTAP